MQVPALNRIVLFFSIFTLSGFSGLIYESVWSHYLKLFLGHAAYAQVLVLVNFMGGLALGAWLAAKFSPRIPNLLLAYALVEAVVGVLGLGFHGTFKYVTAFSYDTVLTGLDSPALVHAYKWLLASMLIFPPSLLLGTTFPLMSNGLVRLLPDTPGRCIATLYFCNSIGAAVGVLVSGFYLINKVGLPGTIMTASIINIFLAVVVYFAVKNITVGKAPGPPVAAAPVAEQPLVRRWPLLLLTASFITGMASFIYEIAWIRMLSMVLGSSTNAFELMLSAFITGLALGGLWVRKRLDNFKNPLRVSAMVQIAMGLCALATIPLYNYTFDLMAFFMQALDTNEDAYLLFNLSSHFIVLLVMLPATFFAGMTLPLFTLLLINNNYGERSIGHIYASNTLGAITGVIFTIFIGMPWLGLKGSMLVGGMADIVLGLVLLYFAVGPARLQLLRLRTAVFAGAGLMALLGLQQFVHFDTKRMGSGVFRYGKPSLAESISVLSHVDGSTASITVTGMLEGRRAISTNGKIDASLFMERESDPTSDEYTMIYAAALPLAIRPQARSVANIGFGSGLTTHTLLLSDTIETVDTIEIEPAMIEGARLFAGRNDKAFSDPRSHINIEDAKTYFHSRNKRYDIIISEPSNPWVSGISSLFTTEFYRNIKKYINDDGIFVQWLQLYEIDMEIVASILAALSENFADYQIYTSDQGNLIIVASPERLLELPRHIPAGSAELRSELDRIGLNNIQDIAVRLLGNKRIFTPYLQLNGFNANSDFFPLIDSLTAKARFIQSYAVGMHEMRQYPVPLVQFLLPGFADYPSQDVTGTSALISSRLADEAQKIYRFIVDNDFAEVQTFSLYNADFLLGIARDCRLDINTKMWTEALFSLYIRTVAYLHGERLLELGRHITPACAERIPPDIDNLLQLYTAYGKKDLHSMAHFSRAVWAADLQLNSGQKEFIFATLMLSLVLLEEYEEALTFWHETIEDLYPGRTDIPFPLIILNTVLIHK